MSRRSRGLVSAAALLVALAAFPGRASADAPPAGPRAWAERLLAPDADAALPGTDWRLVDARFQGGGILLSYRPAEGRTRVDITVTPRGGERPAFRSTAGFDLAYSLAGGGPGGQAAARRVAEAVVAAVQRNDPGDLGPALARDAASDAAAGVASAPGGPSTWGPAVRLALQLLLALLVLATAHIVATALAEAPVPGRVLAALGALFLAALALRLLLSPHAFLHEYYHHGRWLPTVLRSSSVQSMYGETGPALYRLAEGVLGDWEAAVFRTNAVLSALAVPAVVLLARAFRLAWGPALFAGLLLCVSPLHLRYSASEDPIVPATLFGLWTLALAVRWVDDRRHVTLAAAVAALALVMQSRAEMLAFPAVAAAFVVAARGRAGLRALVTPPAFAAAGVLVVLVAPRLWCFLFAQDGGAGMAGEFDALRMLSGLADPSRNVALTGPWASPAHLAILGAGVAWGLVRSRASTLAALGLVAAYVAVTASAFTNPEFLARTQVFCVPFLALAAASLADAAAVLARRSRPAGIAAYVLLCAVPLADLGLRAGDVSAPTEAAQEWAFLVEAVPRLPEGRGAELIALDDTGPDDFDPFPVVLLERFGKDVRIRSLRAATDAPAGSPEGLPPARPGLLVYLGMNCHVSRDPARPPAPLADRCLALTRRYVLRPLATRVLDGVPSSTLTYGERPWEIGFYAVDGER